MMSSISYLGLLYDILTVMDIATDKKFDTFFGRFSGHGVFAWYSLSLVIVIGIRVFCLRYCVYIILYYTIT